MDATRISTLLGAVDFMAETLRRLTIGDVFEGFNCVELDSIATVLAVAGHEDVAALIVTRHAVGDHSEGDLHEHIYDLHRAHGFHAAEVKDAAREYVTALLGATDSGSGCSCGMADHGAAGHDGDPAATQDGAQA